MANVRVPKKGDKVRIINCIAARKYKGKVFEVKGCPYIFDRKLVASLKNLSGYFEVKNLEIIDK